MIISMEEFLISTEQKIADFLITKGRFPVAQILCITSISNDISHVNYFFNFFFFEFTFGPKYPRFFLVVLMIIADFLIKLTGETVGILVLSRESGKKKI